MIERYLRRLQLDRVPDRTVDGVEHLMRAHMTAVPFENLDVFWQRGVDTAVEASLTKVLDRGRGGWCFELNGAFAWLLSTLGFDVRLLGAAVLLSGPNPVIDHLALEVVIEGRPHLVDVGFGDGFVRPLPLNAKPDDRLDGGVGLFGFLPSSQGTTLVRYPGDSPADGDRPEAQYRFRRVAVDIDRLTPASDRLYHDPDSHFRRGPVVTRLIDGGPQRVTLTTDRLRLAAASAEPPTDVAVEPAGDEWFDHLERWFGISDRGADTVITGDQ